MSALTQLLWCLTAIKSLLINRTKFYFEKTSFIWVVTIVVVVIQLIGPNDCRFIQLLSPVTQNNNDNDPYFFLDCFDFKKLRLLHQFKHELDWWVSKMSVSFQFQFQFRCSLYMFSLFDSDRQHYWFLPGLVIIKSAINDDLQVANLNESHFICCHQQVNQCLVCMHSS